jgi:hypothetical protein
MDAEQGARGRQSSAGDIGPDEASRLIKRYAERQKIRVELTDEQMDAILGKWDEQDPRMPAEITFYVGDRPVAELRVAGYRYRGDTCCV